MSEGAAAAAAAASHGSAANLVAASSGATSGSLGGTGTRFVPAAPKKGGALPPSKPRPPFAPAKVLTSSSANKRPQSADTSLRNINEAAGVRSNYDPRRSFAKTDEEAPTPRKGRRVAPPVHLEDHVDNVMHSWLDAEAENHLNKQRAVDAQQRGEPHYVPRIPHRRTATLRPAQPMPPPVFEHVPYEDPALWERAHHFKRFASRPELIHDSVWACLGYKEAGLPEALQKLLLASNSPHVRGAGASGESRAQRYNLAMQQLVADGVAPPGLPKHRKLWTFQRRELALSKQFTVPPRPPSSLSDKYPEYTIVEPVASGGGRSACGHGAPRDSCVAGCCPTCGTNLKPWVAAAPPSNMVAFGGGVRRGGAPAAFPAASAAAGRPQSAAAAARRPASSSTPNAAADSATAPSDSGSGLPALGSSSSQQRNDAFHITRSRSTVVPKRALRMATTSQLTNEAMIKMAARVGQNGLKW